MVAADLRADVEAAQSLAELRAGLLRLSCLSCAHSACVLRGVAGLAVAHARQGLDLAESLELLLDLAQGPALCILPLSKGF